MNTSNKERYAFYLLYNHNRTYLVNLNKSNFFVRIDMFLDFVFIIVMVVKYLNIEK